MAILKYLENKTIERTVLGMFLISQMLLYHNFIWYKLAWSISMLNLVYFLIKILISFSTWKLSKGISVINALLYFQITYSVLAILYVIPKLPGHLEVVHASLEIAQYIFIAIIIIIALRWNRKTTYWKHINGNLVTALIGIAICFLLLISIDKSMIQMAFV